MAGAKTFSVVAAAGGSDFHIDVVADEEEAAKRVSCSLVYVGVILEARWWQTKA